ncbi:MAG TPA: hypothetical protein VGM24_13120, partial [Puia sp.]
MTRAKNRQLLGAVTRKQCGEAGLAAVLIALILALHFKKELYVVLAFVFTLITLTIPLILYPFALLWFGLAKWLNRISTTVMMALVFFLVVVPVGILRKRMGRDRMKIKE